MTSIESLLGRDFFPVDHGLMKAVRKYRQNPTEDAATTLLTRYRTSARFECSWDAIEYARFLRPSEKKRADAGDPQDAGLIASALMEPDWRDPHNIAARLFPADGREQALPADFDRADEIMAEIAATGAPVDASPLPRTWETNRYGDRTTTIPGNLAFLRSQMMRRLRRAEVV